MSMSLCSLGDSEVLRASEVCQREGNLCQNHRETEREGERERARERDRLTDRQRDEEIEGWGSRGA